MNATDKNGGTPLDYAKIAMRTECWRLTDTDNGRIEAMRVLVALGEDPAVAHNFRDLCTEDRMRLTSSFKHSSIRLGFTHIGRPWSCDALSPRDRKR